METNGRDHVRENMPIIGVGTYQIKNRQVIFNIIDAALADGYRLFDTAQGYRNEKHIGDALKIFMPKYNLKREDIFVISKLDPSNHGAEKAAQPIDQTLKNLGFDYLDLLLIHWPGVRAKEVNDPLNCIMREESWKIMEKYYREHKLRAIGVSNYTISHMEQLLQHATVLPAVNQSEFHPHYPQTDLINYCREKGIIFQAYSSFGSPRNRHNLFEDLRIIEGAKKYNCSVPQFLLSWAISQGICVLPRSTVREHIIENHESISIKVADDDIHKVISNQPQKYCWDPSSVV